MFFPNFKCPTKRVKDDDPVVEDQDEDEENKEENASDEQDSRVSSSDEESSSDDDAESKEDGKVAAATAEDGHQLSAYELQCLERIQCNKEYLASQTTKAKPISYSENPTPR
jgi:hypothetical protein